MDNFVKLALMTKAKLVFESESTFLSFPVHSPLSYQPDRLKFGTAGELTAQDWSDLVEFSQITNQIPRGVLAPVEEGEALWEIYQDVLTTAQPAVGATMSTEEKARYDRAKAFLYTQSAEGLRQPNAVLIAYSQYRDAHIKAQEEYKNRELTAELSDDPAVQVQWREVDEPRLRQECQRLEQEWLTQGCKAQVEEARQVMQACEARAPSVTWEEWQKSFNLDLDTATDTDLRSAALTGFSPSDLFDAGSWPRFTLTKAEMERLIRQAPPVLKAALGSDLAHSHIDSVSCEYRSVTLIRPWLSHVFFGARFYRLGAAGGELSDGGSPPQGRCPAYITALVFARNVTIRRPAVPVEPRAEVQPVPSQEKLEKPGMLFMLGPNSGAAALSRSRAAKKAVSATTWMQKGAFAQKRLKSYTFREVKQEPAPPLPTDEVTILAFICKRLPRCPDPDPALTWV